MRLAESNHRTLTQVEERGLVERAKRGDIAARNELIVCNQAYILMFARRFSRRGVPIEDLYQEGVLGAIESLKDYDPDRSRYKTHATARIVRWMLNAIEAKSIIRIPKYLHVILSKHGGAIERGESAESIGLSGSQYSTARHVLGLLRTGDGFAGEETAVGSSDPPDVDETGDGLSRLPDAMTVLSETGRTVLRERFGLDGEPKTLRQIGAELGYTGERIRQIEVEALGKLRVAISP